MISPKSINSRSDQQLWLRLGMIIFHHGGFSRQVNVVFRRHVYCGHIISIFYSHSHSSLPEVQYQFVSLYLQVTSISSSSKQTNKIIWDEFQFQMFGSHLSIMILFGCTWTRPSILGVSHQMGHKKIQWMNHKVLTVVTWRYSSGSK